MTPLLVGRQSDTGNWNIGYDTLKPVIRIINAYWISVNRFTTLKFNPLATLVNLLLNKQV